MNQSKTYNIPGRLHSIGSEGIVAGANEILDDELNLKQNEINAITGTHIANDEIHVTAAEKEYWNSKVNPPSYSAPTAKQLTYTGEAQDLLNPGSSTIGNIQYSTDGTNWSTTVPQGTNAGTYTVYWRFIGSEMVYVDSTVINVTIAKANPTYTAPTGKSGLVYNASAQDLINAGSTSDGTISYSEDEENWSSSIPQGTNAGNYTAYWKLTGDANHNDVASTAISVSITKVTPTVTAPTAKSGLAYTGSAQELVNAGSTDFGTLQYSTDNENWGTTIPSATNAGDYSVYYKVVGDNNINDVSAVLVNCSIAKVTPTYTAPTGKTIENPTSATELVNAGSTNFGTMQYSSDNATWSTSIPTSIIEGSHVTYWRIVGDSNIKDVASTGISSTIEFSFVDLGLPSGTKWAKGNIVPKSGGGYKVGNETDYGAHVSWGNVQPHFSSNGSSWDDGYNWGTSDTKSPYKDTAGAAIKSGFYPNAGAVFAANSGYDAARQLLGGSWRMPTATEWKELFDNCTSAWVTKNGVNGREYTSKINGKKVFLPAVGDGDGAKHDDFGVCGAYWSSSLFGASYGYFFYFEEAGTASQNYNSRYHGFSIRAVK